MAIGQNVVVALYLAARLLLLPCTHVVDRSCNGCRLLDAQCAISPFVKECLASTSRRIVGSGRPLSGMNSVFSMLWHDIVLAQAAGACVSTFRRLFLASVRDGS